MASPVVLRVRSDEHLTCVGQTGTGKTELIRHLIAASSRCVAIDTKHELEIKGWRKGWGLPIVSSHVQQIIRPERDEDERLARLVMECWRRRNMRIYVDELASTIERYPLTSEALLEVMRTGRSRKTVVWWASQRPRFVPKLYMTESRVFLVFALVSPDDRHHVAGFVGPEVEQPIDIHHFWYRRPGMRRPELLTLNLKDHRIYEVKHGTEGDTAGTDVRGIAGGERTAQGAVGQSVEVSGGS